MSYLRTRRDGRVAEGTRLESAHTRKGIGGSNPSLSAIPLFTNFLSRSDSYRTRTILRASAFLLGCSVNVPR